MKSMSEEIFQLRPGSSIYVDPDFDFNTALSIAYHYQREKCLLYKHFIDLFERSFDPQDWSTLPFLPIESFKNFAIQSGAWEPEQVFRSSGTTSSTRSRHLVRSVRSYQIHTIRLFEQQFGSLGDFQIFALLPNYLEAGDSSLVAMVSGFMERINQTGGFYMHDFSKLTDDLHKAAEDGRRILLIGVTFALLDFAQDFSSKLPSHSLILETGGMKGRGEELSRSDLHAYLSQQFGTRHVHSEYGMTELMSQAYSDFAGRFLTPSSMAISIREINDPLTEVRTGKVGVINIIDLANIDTCCFVGTSDLGIKYADNTFEVVGRLDQSDIRGCHLMYLES